MANRARKTEHDVWSTNLRTLGRLGSNSDSDSDVDSRHRLSTQPGRAPVLSEDARLIKQIDLSLRQDEAVYIPNPWTIAKMNAAARPLPSRRELPTKSSQTSSVKKPLQRTIVEAFQRRSEKDLQPSSSKCSDPSTRLADNLSADGGDAQAMPKNVARGSTNHTASAFIHKTRPNLSSHSASPSLLSTPWNTSQPKTAYTNPTAGSVSRPSIALSPAIHSAGRNMLQPDRHPSGPLFVHASARPTTEASRLPRTTPGYQDAESTHTSDSRTSAERKNSAHAIPTRPVPPVAKHNSSFHNQSYNNRASNAQFQSCARSVDQYKRTAFSSPIAPPASLSSKIPTSYAFSSPLRSPSCVSVPGRPLIPPPIRSKCDFVPLGPPQTSSGTPRRHLVPYRRGSKKISGSSDMSMIHDPNRPTQAAPAQRSPGCSELIIRRSPSPRWKAPKRSHDAYDLPSSPDAAWSTLPTSKRSRKKAAEPGNKASAKFRLPIASVIPQTGSTTKSRSISYLPPAHKASSQAQSTPNGNSNPPAVGWKVTRITPSQLRGELHPAFEFSRAPISRTSGTDRARRDEQSPRAEHDSRWAARAARNYPSPPRCNSSPPQDLFTRSPHQDNTAQLPPSMHSLSESASSVTPHTVPRRQMVAGRNSLPSPPRSDSPSALQSDICADDDGDPDGRDRVHLPFNSELLEDRYVKMRRKISSRKQAAARVWDDLELPSCGTVYRSPGVHAVPLRRLVEIPIVVWEGRNAVEDRNS